MLCLAWALGISCCVWLLHISACVSAEAWIHHLTRNCLKSCQALTLAWEGRLLIVSGAEKGHFLSLPFPCSDTNMEMKLGSRILAFWKVHTV